MEKHARKPFTAPNPMPSFSIWLLVFLSAARNIEGNSFSVKGKFLLGYEIRGSFQTDWITCLLSCQNDSECVSYNFNKKNNSCQLNSHGVGQGCMAEGILHSGEDYIFHQVKNGRIASRRISKKCSCNCGEKGQCTSRTGPGLGDTKELAANSCQEILRQRSHASSGPYYLKAFGSTAYTYCHMTELPGCGGGGWTLVIKMDGNKQTFSYDSNKWSAMVPHEPKNGENLLETETLLPTYWSTHFTRLCLGMKYNGDTNWIAVDHAAKTLLSVMSGGNRVETHLNVSAWKSLLNDSSLQTACTKQGFNVLPVKPQTASARIGITGFLRDCSGTSASRIGFGTGGDFYGMDKSNTCGNEAKSNSDKGDSSIKAFGYIFIQ